MICTDCIHNKVCGLECVWGAKLIGCEYKKTELPHNTGYWIIIDDCEKFIAKCSECGQIEDSRMIGKYAYCHCGAKMD